MLDTPSDDLYTPQVTVEHYGHLMLREEAPIVTGRARGHATEGALAGPDGRRRRGPGVRRQRGCPEPDRAASMPANDAGPVGSSTSTATTAVRRSPSQPCSPSCGRARGVAGALVTRLSAALLRGAALAGAIGVAGSSRLLDDVGDGSRAVRIRASGYPARVVRRCGSCTTRCSACRSLRSGSRWPDCPQRRLPVVSSPNSGSKSACSELCCLASPVQRPGNHRRQSGDGGRPDRVPHLARIRRDDRDLVAAQSVEDRPVTLNAARCVSALKRGALHGRHPGRFSAAALPRPRLRHGPERDPRH